MTVLMSRQEGGTAGCPWLTRTHGQWADIIHSSQPTGLAVNPRVEGSLQGPSTPLLQLITPALLDRDLKNLSMTPRPPGHGDSSCQILKTDC